MARPATGRQASTQDVTSQGGRDLNRHTRNILAIATLLAVAACGNEPATVTKEMPEPEPDYDTPYAIGNSTIFIHDESRPYDSVNGIDEGIRTLITEIWYPVDHAIAGSGEYRRATYGDYVFGDRDVHRLMMMQTTFFHLTPDTVREGVTDEQVEAGIDELFNRERGSYIDAPLADVSEPLPVVVFSHGDAGSRYNMETVVEYLAAHGYVVIAPEHTGNSPYSLTGRDPAFETDPVFAEKMAGVAPFLSELGAYGEEERYGQAYTPLSSGRDSLEFLVQLDKSLLQRLNDLRAALRELDRMNAEGFAGAGPGKLNLERIGLTGRSFGGATTLVGLSMEPRFTAGFAVVPPGWADPRPALPADMLKADEESVLFAAEGPFPLTDISKPTVLLSGAEDTLIIGLAARMAESNGSTMPTPDNPHPLLHEAFETTDAPVVWGVLADSNHATFGVSGGYWWPDLKPNKQARHFAPDTEFELVDVEIAHRMQKEMALDFFDLTIRRDKRGGERLKNNHYESNGLVLEMRNF